MTAMWAVDQPVPVPSLLAYGDSFGWHANSGNLLLSILCRPTRDERRAHRAGAGIRLALHIHIPLLVLYVKFGSLPWQEGSWAWCEGAEAPAVFEAGDAALFQDILVDGNSGRITSVRAFTATREFTRQLGQAFCAVQRHGPIAASELRVRALEHQTRYPDIGDAARRAAITASLKATPTGTG